MLTITPHVTAIHTTPHQLVFEFAGAGSQALTWLHSVGGSSRTVLEATDRYAATSLADLIGFQPTQFSSTGVATAMATKAFFRGSKLSPLQIDTPRSIIGVGCTATIATDRTKKGNHRAYIAIFEADQLHSYELIMEKGTRTREQEENLVSQLIIWSVAKTCHVVGSPSIERFKRVIQLKKNTETLTEQVSNHNLLNYFMKEQIPWLLATPGGEMFTAPTMPNISLLSGSFNPLHNGHQQMAQAVQEMTGQTVYFELSLVNAEKQSIAVQESKRRLTQFANFAPLLLTQSPLFSQKARLFPSSNFIIGVDTALRLLQPRFYNHNLNQMAVAFETIRQAGCRFLVAGRFHKGNFLSWSKVSCPPKFADLFDEIPASRFRLDISSTQIRNSHD
ncbi:hypothetical protein QUF64_04760 [Anaerolineales bacterium HSG6]|nr:hypothetical protein [Anaerolineales bacterium HSG6]